MAGGTRENIPNPDPSLLTTTQLLREVEGLKELMFSKMATIERDHLHEKELTAERFRGVYEKFTDNKEALDKAFNSSEKAIDKTETTFTNRIVASDARLNDVRDRLTVVESRSVGKSEGIGMIGSAVMGAIAAVSVCIAAATLLYNIFHR